MACARAWPEDREDAALDASESQVRDPSGVNTSRREVPVKGKASPCCMRTLWEGRASDAASEVDLTVSKSSPSLLKDAQRRNVHLMVHSSSSTHIEGEAQNKPISPLERHVPVVVEATPQDAEARTMMLQRCSTRNNEECAWPCSLGCAIPWPENIGVAYGAMLGPAKMTTVDIVFEPGGTQNLLVPDLTIGSPSAASQGSARLAHEDACIYDMSICDVASPVSLYVHGRNLVARQEATTTITVDPGTLSTAASRTLQTSTASSTATSSPAVSSVLGPLLGGLLGGFFGLLLIVIAIWYTWTSRHHLFRRDDTLESQTAPTTPNVEHKLPDRSHRQSTLSSPTLTPQPYQYGVVGRPGSRLSTSMSASTSSPHSPNPSRSRSHSPGPSVLTYSRPPSTVMNIMVPPSPTPGAPAGINTPISPGPSLAPSSRPPTPGVAGYPFPLQQYHSEWQQQQARVSWPQMSHSEEGHAADPRRSPVLRPRSERRPSRLSLTLTNWNPETDGILGELEAGEKPATQSGEALADSTACSVTAVGSSREGGGEGEAGVEVSQETLTPANAGPTDASGAGS